MKAPDLLKLLVLSTALSITASAMDPAQPHVGAAVAVANPAHVVSQAEADKLQELQGLLAANRLDVNRELINAVQFKYQAVVLWIFGLPGQRYSQIGINLAIRIAGSTNQPQMVDLLANPPAEMLIRPTQVAIDEARLAIGEQAIVGVEAIVQQTDAMRQAYIELTTNAATAPLINRYLPTAAAADAEFAQCYEQLMSLVEAAAQVLPEGNPLRFRYNNAIRSLKLLNGDITIECHSISLPINYTNYTIAGMPNIRQLFVLAYKLMTIDPAEYVKGWLAERYINPTEWQKFAKLFAGAECFAGLDTNELGIALQTDAKHGNKFVKTLAACVTGEVTIEGADHKALLPIAKQIMPMKTAYKTQNLEKLIPLIEALFMIMRGHNANLLDPNQPNNPACAEGAYLGMLKAIDEHFKTAGVILGAGLAGIEIADCG